MAALNLADLPQDLHALQALLEAHLQAMPTLPQPYLPNTQAGLAYYDARTAWSDTRRRLEHEIWKAQTPKTVFERVAPRVFPRAEPQGPVRLRR